MNKICKNYVGFTACAGKGKAKVKEQHYSSHRNSFHSLRAQCGCTVGGQKHENESVGKKLIYK